MTDGADAQPSFGPGDELAGFAQRAMARAVDLMVVAVISLALFAQQLAVSGDDDSVPRWTQIAVFAMWMVYEAGTTAFLGQTMGKLAAGIRVANRQTGRRPGLARSIVRTAVVPGLLPLIALFGLLGYATAFLDRNERRGIPDRLAGTVVVKAVPGERR